MKDEITYDLLHEIFEYNSCTGDLTNKIARHYKVEVGSLAPSINIHDLEYN